MNRTIGAGTQLGNYRLLEPLGAGGAGNVFVALDLESDSGQRVALKVLRPGADEIEEIHARFIREITVAQKLSDPHVVAYHDCGVEDGVLYYAMQHVPWGSLAEVLRQRGAIPWKEACECGIQICQGLSHLHELGIVHRDLKPANIFLSDDGRLKLGDFGLARDIEMHSLTDEGLTVGTAKYISPEQARGASDIDVRADLYALGCNLFEYVYGKTPFAMGDAHVDMGELMRRHVQEAPPKLIDVVPTCPPRLSDLVSRLLSKDRSRRPESAQAVAEELRGILENPDAPSELPSDSESEATLTERLRPAAPIAANISPARLIGIVAVIVVLIAVVAIMANQ